MAWSRQAPLPAPIPHPPTHPPINTTATSHTHTRLCAPPAGVPRVLWHQRGAGDGRRGRAGHPSGFHGVLFARRAPHSAARPTPSTGAAAAFHSPRGQILPTVCPLSAAPGCSSLTRLARVLFAGAVPQQRDVHVLHPGHRARTRVLRRQACLSTTCTPRCGVPVAGYGPRLSTLAMHAALPSLQGHARQPAAARSVQNVRGQKPRRLRAGSNGNARSARQARRAGRAGVCGSAAPRRPAPAARLQSTPCMHSWR